MTLVVIFLTGLLVGAYLGVIAVGMCIAASRKRPKKI